MSEVVQAASIQDGSCATLSLKSALQFPLSTYKNNFVKDDEVTIALRVAIFSYDCRDFCLSLRAKVTRTDYIEDYGIMSRIHGLLLWVFLVLLRLGNFLELLAICFPLLDTPHMNIDTGVCGAPGGPHSWLPRKLQHLR